MVRKIKKPGAPQVGQQDIIRQAQQMQQEMLKIQEELKDKVVETSVGGGAVTIKANGQKQILEMNLSLDILKDAVDEEDPTIVADMIINAVNEILEKAEELAEKEMELVRGGVNIPGLF